MEYCKCKLLEIYDHYDEKNKAIAKDINESIEVYNSMLDDFIAYGKTLTISYQNLSLTEIFDDIKFPMFNIVQDYINELKDEAITITFTDKEYYKYK